MLTTPGNELASTCFRDLTALEVAGAGKVSGPWQAMGAAGGSSSGAERSASCVSVNVQGRKEGVFCDRIAKSSADGRCGLPKTACSASRYLDAPRLSSVTRFYAGDFAGEDPEGDFQPGSERKIRSRAVGYVAWAAAGIT